MRSHDVLRSAKEFIIRQGGEIAPLGLSEEDLNPHEQDDLTLRAHHIEPMDRVYAVDYNYPRDAGQSEFRYFEDGRQRTLQIGHIPVHHGEHLVLLPVHYFAVGAVILERRADRQLQVWQSPIIEEGIFVARSLVGDHRTLEEIENRGLRIVSTDRPGKNDYYALRSIALQEAKKLRLEVEDRLIKRWRTSDDAKDSYLVVDGTLMNFRDEENVNRCVGVSKSFGSRYFSPTANAQIMQLNEFERSWTFRFHEEEGDDLRKGARERMSWYLRLRSDKRHDPEFGLVRVEISKTYIKDSTAYAARFSKSLISERLPTSYPYPRWDKHLFPIRECENYLSSIMPSGSTITASMKV